MFRTILCAAAAAICFAALPARALDESERQPYNTRENMLGILNERIKNSDGLKVKQRTAPGIEQAIKGAQDNIVGGHVPRNRAKLCDICQELLARHSEPGFECIPLSSTGERMPVARLEWKTIKCPCCSVQFKGAVPGNVNAKNGIDRDFCRHSIGKASVHSSVWTCADCGYAAFIDTFGQTWNKMPIDDETRAFVRKEVTPGMFARMVKLAGLKPEAAAKISNGNGHFADLLFKEDMQQDQIADWIKYENAIKIYRFQKAPSAIMARLYMEAAHACRRELAGEIAIPVAAAQEESLSLSLRRIQFDLTVASQMIRQERSQTAMIDPYRADTDATVMAEACERILNIYERRGMRIIYTRPEYELRRNVDPTYTEGDMFVLQLRYAGYLDRLGRMDDADTSLAKAKRSIPSNIEYAEASRAEADFIEKQMKVMREYVDNRRKVLEMERECINRAMWELLVTVNNKQVRFLNQTSLLSPPAADQIDPAEMAYMIGERARRCGEPAAAPAFLAATEAIIDRQLAQIDKEEKEAALKKDAPDIQRAALERSKHLGDRWTTLRQWATEQRAMSANTGTLDETIKKVLDQLLTVSGIDPATYKGPEAPPAKAAAKQAHPGDAASPTAPVAAVPSTIKTRDELFKLYYDALAKHAKEKKANPAKLSDLVAAGYVPAEAASLNDSGKLICPETQEVLMYLKSFTIGDASRQVLVPTKNTLAGKMLWADGSIASVNERVKNKN